MVITVKSPFFSLFFFFFFGCTDRLKKIKRSSPLFSRQVKAGQFPLQIQGRDYPKQAPNQGAQTDGWEHQSTGATIIKPASCPKSFQGKAEQKAAKKQRDESCREKGTHRAAKSRGHRTPSSAPDPVKAGVREGSAVPVADGGCLGLGAGLTSQNRVSLSSGRSPLASSSRKSLLMNFLKPQSLPCTKR